MLTAIAGTGFGPRETGLTQGRLRQNVRARGSAAPCKDTVSIGFEEFEGKVSGVLRNIPVSGSLVTRLTDCDRTGETIIESARALRGEQRLANGRVRQSYNYLYVAAKRANGTSPYRLELTWYVNIVECGESPPTPCVLVYNERNTCVPDQGRCPLSADIVSTGTGISFDGNATARIERAAPNQPLITNVDVEQSLSGSISGRWARVHITWTDARGATGSADVATAPEPDGWRVQRAVAA